MDRKRSRDRVTKMKPQERTSHPLRKKTKHLIPAQVLLGHRPFFIMVLALSLRVRLSGLIVTVHRMHLAVDGVLGLAKVEVGSAEGSNEGNKG